MFWVKREPSRAELSKIATCTLIWRLLFSPPMDGPDNMALDLALMGRARRSGETVLRVYEWNRATLSFGRNQRVAGAYDTTALARAGVDVIRRPTGGRTLLHSREITYSVTAPASTSISETYAGINALLVHALGALGVPVSVFQRATRSLAPNATPCFAEPAAGELVADGAKLVGSAQWRDDGAMLQHGSILADDDQATIGSFMTGPSDPVSPPATLRALLGRVPSAREVGEELRAAVRSLADPSAEWFSLEAEVEVDARQHALQFRDAAWTWRR